MRLTPGILLGFEFKFAGAPAACRQHVAADRCEVTAANIRRI